MSKKAKEIPLWKDLVAYIDDSWKKKKGRKYPFCGKDFKLLKTLTRFYTVPEICALWSTYLLRSPFWGSKTGFLIDGLWAERAVLLDDPMFKRSIPEHEKRLGYKEQKDLWEQLTA